MAQEAPPVPGLVFVPMSLKAGLSVQECDDWYNNEHVPIRMRHPYFQRGYRYRGVDTNIPSPSEVDSPEWLALYDLGDMWQLTKEPYGRLLTPAVQSLREHEILTKVAASRKYYDLVSTYESDQFVTLEDMLRERDFERAYSGTLIIVGVQLASDKPEAEKEWDRCYEEDHLPPLRKVPGWRRTRRYRSSIIENLGSSKMEYLTVNEFAEDSAIGGPEHQVAIASEKKTTVVKSKWRQAYKLHYVQGPASRDLAALYRNDVTDFISPDGLTQTLSGPSPFIRSYITIEGKVIQYRLGGAIDAKRHVVALSTIGDFPRNSVHGFTKYLCAEGNYRILQLSLPVHPKTADHAASKCPVSDRVAEDLSQCFKAFMFGRVATVVIFSLGGITTADGDSPHAASFTLTKNATGLAGLCDRSFSAVCHSSKGIDEAIDRLTTA